MRWAARSLCGLSDPRRRDHPPWAAIEPMLWSAPPGRHVIDLVRSLRRAPPRVNRVAGAREMPAAGGRAGMAARADRPRRAPGTAAPRRRRVVSRRRRRPDRARRPCRPRPSGRPRDRSRCARATRRHAGAAGVGRRHGRGFARGARARRSAAAWSAETVTPSSSGWPGTPAVASRRSPSTRSIVGRSTPLSPSSLADGPFAARPGTVARFDPAPGERLVVEHPELEQSLDRAVDELGPIARPGQASPHLGHRPRPWLEEACGRLEDDRRVVDRRSPLAALGVMVRRRPSPGWVTMLRPAAYGLLDALDRDRHVVDLGPDLAVDLGRRSADSP